MKIISLVPAETELLCDLGLEEKIIGVTDNCIHPYYIKHKKENLGTQIDIARIKELNPDIILCNTDLHSIDEINLYKEICQVHISTVNNIDDLLQLILHFGKLFNHRTQADNLILKLKFKFKDFMNFIKDKEWQKIAYFVNENPWKVIAGNSFTNHILRLNNFQNIYSNRENLSEVNIKRIRLEGDPDYVFLSSEHNFSDETVFELGRSTHHAKTVFIDHTMFSWGGSRLLKAFEYYKEIHERIRDK